MLWATNAALQALGEEALVSFDTILDSTNNNVKIVDEEKIEVTKPGWYEFALRGVFVNTGSTSEITAGIRLVTNETEEVQGSKATWKVPASGSVPAYISIPVHVVTAPSGAATLSWQMTDQVTLKDVMLMVKRIV